MRSAIRTALALMTLALIAAVPAMRPHPAAAAGAVGAPNATYVRILHASPDAPPVEVFVDGAKVLPYLAYAHETPFLALAPGSVHIQVFPAGAAYTRAGGVISIYRYLGPGAYTTVAAIGLLGAHTLRASITNDIRYPFRLTGATVRFAHFAPNAPEVDVVAQGAGRLFFASYPFVTPYFNYPSGVYNLSIRPTGAKTAVLSVPGVRFRAGHIYTVYAIGLVGRTNYQRLNAIVSDDTP